MGIRSDLISLRTHAIGLPISSSLGAVSCDIPMLIEVKRSSLSLPIERAHLRFCVAESLERALLFFFFLRLAQKQNIPARLFFFFFFPSYIFGNVGDEFVFPTAKGNDD